MDRLEIFAVKPALGQRGKLSATRAKRRTILPTTSHYYRPAPRTEKLFLWRMPLLFHFDQLDHFRAGSSVQPALLCSLDNAPPRSSSSGAAGPLLIHFVRLLGFLRPEKPKSEEHKCADRMLSAELGARPARGFRLTRQP
jgi:hypothetical protein